MKLFKDFISFVIEQYQFTNCLLELVKIPCYAVFTIKKGGRSVYESSESAFGDQR